MSSCREPSGNNEPVNDYIQIDGRTMGTYYKIIYEDSLDRDFRKSIDSLLSVINNSMSTYIPNSIISFVNDNHSDTDIDIDNHFYNVFVRAKEIYELSSGAFNPSVMPLVRYFGFATDEPVERVDSIKVDSLLWLIRFENFHAAKIIYKNQLGKNETSYQLFKEDPFIELDFSAIAKGYGVDVIFEFLKEKGFYSIFVDIGGEINAMGKDLNSDIWTVGIEDPINSTLDKRVAKAHIRISASAVATSGNYRNIREIEGVKYSHTINPFTGFPEKNSLLSATVIARDCMTADALATACMVLGKEKGKILIDSLDNTEGYFIFSKPDASVGSDMTEGFVDYLHAAHPN